MEIIRNRNGKSKKKIRSFLRYEKFYNNKSYLKKTLVKFLEPKSVKGTSLLSWVKDDGNSDVWFFLPKLKVAKKIKSKEKGKSFMATDFIYEDFDRRQLGDDIFLLDDESNVDCYNCLVIQSSPIKDSAYFSKKIYVDKKILQVRKVEFFESKSVLSKTLLIKEMLKKDKYWIPTLMEMWKPNGNHTIMKVKAYKPGVELDDAVFTKEFLIGSN